MRARLIATYLVALSCKAEAEGTEVGPQQSPAQVSPPTAAQGEDASRSIAIDCAMNDAIPAGARAEVERTARGWLTALRDGRHQALWDALHPQAVSEAERQPFLDTLATLQSRLSGSPGEPRVETLAVAKVAGGINSVARVVCREGDAQDGPPTLTILTNAGDEDVAYASLVVDGEVFDQAVTFQLRKRETWRLLGASVNPSSFHGKDAAAWVGEAARYDQKGKPVPAYVALAMAQAMATRGSTISTQLTAAIGSDLDRIAKSPRFSAETREWIVDGQQYSLHGLSLAATASDVSLVVKYVNPGGLVEELVGRDADKLMDHVRTEYPELKNIVDAVVFEAYATAPEGKTSDAFRVVRMF